MSAALQESPAASPVIPAPRLDSVPLASILGVTAPKDTGYMIPSERLDNAILEIRGRKVLLSHDLAALYGVSTKAFNWAVKRNVERFPEDSMFQLTREEAQALRSQSVTLGGVGSRSQSATPNGRPVRGGQRYRPYAFSEHGQ